MFYDKQLSLICAYSVKGRKCESNARYTDGSPIDQWWNILSSDWKFVGLPHSLEYVFALLPEFLRDNIRKVNPLYEEVSLLWCWVGGSGGSNTQSSSAGFSIRIVGGWYTMLMTIFVLAIERRTIATSVFQSFYMGNSIFFWDIKI